MTCETCWFYECDSEYPGVGYCKEPHAERADVNENDFCYHWEDYK
jgi:hypothetical protein